LKLHSGERSGDTWWDEKTPWSFTAACCCGFGLDTERSRERRSIHFGEWGALLEHRFSFLELLTASQMSDISKWAVWLGRLSLEKISRETNGQLKRVRNPL
jgi:hypothetical protein